MKPELVIFDWDGTLMDTVPKIVAAMKRAAAELNLSVPDEGAVKDIIGMSLEKAVTTIFGETADCDVIAKAYQQAYLECELESPLFNGVHELMTWLRENDIQIAVATGKSRKGLERYIQLSNLGHYFAASRTACEARSKPDPDMLLQIIDELNVAPERVVMVGDTKVDMALAKNANISAVAITHGAHGYDELKSCEPEAIVNSIAELTEYFKSL